MHLPSTPHSGRLVFSALVVLVLGLGGTAWGQATGSAAPTVEERLRRLEATVQTLQTENAALRRELGAANASSTTPTKPALLPMIPGATENQLVVGGFLHAHAEFGGAPDARWAGVNDRFFFRRARIYLRGTYAEHFEFKIEGEFGAGSLSPGSGLRASGNEMFVGWNRYPIANVRFGQLKPAFGGEQLGSDTKLATIERFLGNDRLTDSRQLGMSLGGELIPKRLNYLIVIGNGVGPNSSANDNRNFMHTARLSGVALDDPAFGKLMVGVNALQNDDEANPRAGFGFDAVPGGAVDNVFAGSRVGFGFDVAWSRGPFDLSAEWLQMRFKPRNPFPASVVTGEGWHVTAAWFVLPKTLQAVIRQEQFDPNVDLGQDVSRTWVFGVNYFLKGDDLKFMFDYLLGDAPGLIGTHGRLLSRFQILF